MSPIIAVYGVGINVGKKLGGHFCKRFLTDYQRAALRLNRRRVDMLTGAVFIFK